jgi:hypothetical protein
MASLDSLRALWIAAARELVDAFDEATPARELGGILGRASELLEKLAENLDDFAEVALEGPERDLEAIEECLMGARRIPRCVLAFSSELERAEEDRAWASLRERAALLRLALRGFQHVILLRELGVDLVPSLPEPRLTSLARLGRAARLEQLGSVQDLEEGPEDAEE